MILGILQDKHSFHLRQNKIRMNVWKEINLHLKIIMNIFLRGKLFEKKEIFTENNTTKQSTGMTIGYSLNKHMNLMM